MRNTLGEFDKWHVGVQKGEVMVGIGTDELLEPEEVSTTLKIPVATLYMWRYRGSGPPAVPLGRHLRYSRRALEEWLRERAEDERRGHA
jgi:predicted DNA-binding transcriptional regulator AlpA